MWRLLSPNKEQGWKHPPAPPVLHSHLNHWAGRGAAGSDVITNPQENNCRSKGPEKEGRAGGTQGRGWRGGQGRGRAGQGMEGRAEQGTHRAGGQRAEQGVSQERKPKRGSQTREDQQRGSTGDPHSSGPTNSLLCRPPILNQTTLQTKPGINIPSVAPCLLGPCSRWPLAFGGTSYRPSCSHCHCSSVIKINSHNTLRPRLSAATSH